VVPGARPRSRRRQRARRKLPDHRDARPARRRERGLDARGRARHRAERIAALAVDGRRVGTTAVLRR
jgi:hypothetical protein